MLSSVLTFLEPLGRKVGSTISGSLVTYGVTQETSQQIVIGLSALAGVLLDLLLSRRAHR